MTVFKDRVITGLNRRINAYLFSLSKLWKRHLYDLVVLDDNFPTITNLFRVIEFNNYLEKYDTKVLTSSNGLGKKGGRIQFKKDVNTYRNYYPELAPRIGRLKRYVSVRAKLAYFVFLHNGIEFISYIEKNKIPFVFTLYPGGEFRFNQERSDRHLRRLLSSQYFRNVIVTQNITYKYLVDNNMCPIDKITFIYGGFAIPFKEEYLKPKDTTTFDIGFSAKKYSPQGKDKGYDIYIEVAKRLAKKIDNLIVHVVGGYDESDYDISEIKDKVVFHGTLKKDEYIQTLSEFDVFLSPNRSNILAEGAFDGFPLCEDAGILGAAMFVTDELKQNEYFEDGVEFEIINHDPETIAEKVYYYYCHPEKLRALASKGQAKLTSLFSNDAQMNPRFDVLNTFIYE